MKSPKDECKKNTGFSGNYLYALRGNIGVEEERKFEHQRRKQAEKGVWR